ncbi:unnamed protein product [Symbiodinium natans]|uniref:Uncharacterized protein n=1 Tax=Symbiodinium natans TaxID=878477 RepID=A0A812M7G6_9DINO|nr:unnamed protein product [Symbiodinium natans]
MTILGVGQFVDAGLMEGLAALLTAPRGEAALVLRAALAAGAVACAARAVEVGLEWAWQQAQLQLSNFALLLCPAL